MLEKKLNTNKNIPFEIIQPNHPIKVEGKGSTFCEMMYGQVSGESYVRMLWIIAMLLAYFKQYSNEQVCAVEK